jgi:hypothetical protein
VAVLLHLGDDETVIEAIGVILKKGLSATLNPYLLVVVRKQFTETVVDEANVLFKLRRIEVASASLRTVGGMNGCA